MKHNHQHHIHHIEEFKKKFSVSMILTIPILFFSEMIQNWFGFILIIPFQKQILFSLSLIIYIYGGLPFIKGLFQELRKKQPGMMTLIGTAISFAFFLFYWNSFLYKWKRFLLGACNSY